jgi:hypothetical protein
LANELRRLADALGGESPFPRQRGKAVQAATTPAGSGSEVSSGRKARYHMTAAQKRAVSERMKKYWAARRKAKKAQ